MHGRPCTHIEALYRKQQIRLGRPHHPLAASTRTSTGKQSLIDERSPILLTGANGRTGRAVLRALATRKVSVRALVRNPAQAEALRARGAHDVVVGDLGTRESLDHAAAGCAGVIHIGPPLHPLEVDYTRNVIAAAHGAGVDHILYYSVMHPLCGTLRHHALKLEAERRVVESGIAFTIVQPIRYMQHLEPIWRQVVDDGVHAMPFGVDASFNLADLDDLAEATARAATDAGLQFGIFGLAGPQPLSQRDAAMILTEELGRPVEARHVTPREFASASTTAADRLIQLMTMNDYYDRHGFRGSPAVLQMLLGRPATRFRDYVRRLVAAERGQ